MNRLVALEVAKELLSNHEDACIECFSKEEDRLCRYFMNLIGRAWCTGASYIHMTHWGSNTQSLCYFYNEGCYGVEDYKKEATEVGGYYTWSEVASILSECSKYASALPTISNSELEAFLYG